MISINIPSILKYKQRVIGRKKSQNSNVFNIEFRVNTFDY